MCLANKRECFSATRWTGVKRREEGRLVRVQGALSFPLEADLHK